jgi:hypothetical protein
MEENIKTTNVNILLDADTLAILDRMAKEEKRFRKQQIEKMLEIAAQKWAGENLKLESEFIRN